MPILQLALESDTLTEQQLFDYGINFVRARAWPRSRARRSRGPYGGKQRQIMVDIDPQRLYALRPLAARRQRRDQRAEPDPARRHREDRHATSTRSRSTRSPEALDEINDLPIKTVNGTHGLHPRRRQRARRLRAADQHGARRRASARVLMSILKNGNASARSTSSTRMQGMLPAIAGAAAARTSRSTLLFDQSLFVRAAVDGVVKEAADRRRADRR